MFSLCTDAPEGAAYYPQNIMLHFYISYHKNYYATLMLLEKLCYMKTLISGTKHGTDPRKLLGLGLHFT